MTIGWCIAIALLVCVLGVGWLWRVATHAPILPYPRLSCRAAHLRFRGAQIWKACLECVVRDRRDGLLEPRNSPYGVSIRRFQAFCLASNASNGATSQTWRA